MANKYDKQTTTFSQNGRLYQVEYAVEATKNAGPAIGVLGKSCVVLAGEKKTSSKLLDQAKQAEKVFEIDSRVAVAVAGVTSDANTLIEHIRRYAQQYQFSYGEPIPVEQLVTYLCDTKQAYTQSGGIRPFGVSFLFAGYDQNFGFQLYQSDPAGNYGGWRAHSIGSLHNSTTDSILKQDWNADLSVQQVKELVAKVLMKNSDGTPDAEKFEWMCVEKGADGRIKFKRLSHPEVEKLLKEAKAKEDAAEP
eukprot:gene170-187_t